MSESSSYGVLASFGGADSLLRAVTELRSRGHGRLEVYSPFPIDGLQEALEIPGHNAIARWVLAGALFGGIGTLFLQWYSSVIAYPLDVGGRPYASWPAFVPASLEMVFLFAALFGTVAMLLAGGLPLLYHAVFNVERFSRSSSDGFFVLIRADDPAYGNDEESLRDLLGKFNPLSIDDVAQ